ncbi:MAG: DUF1579 domain-containing protein [Gemmatimonadota bacterium]|nr:DUF1579 domain-containing protein [Gemmatimonadota bacterium]
MSLPLQPGAPNDFDFVVGDWRVHHRRLKDRLVGCTEWEIFEGLSSTRTTLGGFGNVEDNQIFLPSCPYRAAAIRSFDPHSQLWSIWWLDSRSPRVLDTPVVGQFRDGVGTFYADDTLNERPVRIRFTWRTSSSGAPRWDQAFSADGGITWETNWEMTFVRMA